MFKRISLLVIASLLLSGCTNPLSGISLSKKSGLQATSIPQATVFLDGNSLGTTPVREENLKPGEHQIKLVPTDPSLQAWETKLDLTPGVLTAVDRTLATIANDASGFTLSFKPLKNKRDTILEINTIPDSVTINVDGTPQGFTPRTLDTISAGDHAIVFSSPGYIDKTVRAKAIEGYRLIVEVQLAKAPAPVFPTPEATPSAQPTLTTSPTPTSSKTPTKTPTPTVKANTNQATSSAYLVKPYVEVLNTPQGWLRVRVAPSTDKDEIAKVNSGETFRYIETSPDGGWFRIEYAPGSQGWIAKQYSRLVK